MLEITDAEFKKIVAIMYEQSGVFLKPSKKPLVMSRLRERLQELGMKDFKEYTQLLSQPHSDELENFINAITTNETYFFRHTRQFNMLYETILPEMMRNKAGRSREVSIWTAACSTGEEPYSLAILCKEFFLQHPGFRYKIYASDINTEVLDDAREGVYSERSVKEIPDNLLEKYFKKMEIGKFHKASGFRIADIIKEDVEFSQHNLLYPFKYKDIDIVFLRNVMIYFDNDIKERVVRLIYNNMASPSYMFISLSESLNDINTGFELLESAVYKKG
ncbi:MAG TPA: CheR family methyltransferase [Candidatus Omnitrophota bacterium]|nr:CheR family methyltransferase [Candidatus Omnitrophota bacterium]HPS20117.1 CheR family methyltransferase [Candidatus Omnitrophota bacterium]